MAGFLKKIWKPRIVEYPGRRRLDDTSQPEVYDVSRAEGNIIQQGDGFTADNMNDLEERIFSGFDNAGKVISDEFSTAKTYSSGEYAIYNNALYRFTAAKPAGAWDASKAVAVTLVEEINELNGKMAIRSLLFRENIPPNTEYVYDDNVSLGSILLLGGTWNHKEMYVLYISYIEEGWRNLIVNRIASYNSYSTFEFRITDAGKLAIKNITEVTQPTLAYMIDSP